MPSSFRAWIHSSALLLAVWQSSLFPTACAYYLPDVTRKSIAGLWSLKEHKQAPMKEFTVRPIRKKKEEERELLLMLKEDGSFRQYKDAHDVSFTTARDLIEKATVLKGTWDFREDDHTLILAKDRTTESPTDNTNDNTKNSPLSPAALNKEDTILEGRVVATAEQGLEENPVLQEKDKQEAPSSEVYDVHLSVPQGSVKTGRFTYPPRHPSFFENPMFQPRPVSRFQLKQVLGTLNTAVPEEEEIEKFSVRDLYNKRFSVTSHPLENRPRGQLRWSIRQNKFVEELPDKVKEQQDALKNRPVPIRCMEVDFFANNTFATVAGLGDSTILRGKFDVIGKKRDQLWMQVWRFGFGRSVSGSTFSEGKALTHEDAKTYWGEISYEDEAKDTMEASTDVDKSSDCPQTSEEDNTEEKTMMVKGSVFLGWGLEPQPVGRFIMRELTNVDEEEDDEEEDDDDEEIYLKKLEFDDSDKDGDDIDWTNAFQ